MKLLFIEVDTEMPWGDLASFGPAFIAPILRDAGHEVAFLRARLTLSMDEVVQRVRDEAPGLIGFSLTTRQWNRARGMVAAIRAELDVPVIAGGLHPTFSPDEVLATPGFDFICVGEGEFATLDLLNALDAGAPVDAIDNIRTATSEHRQLRPPVIPDELPFLARDLLDETPGVITMTTQRGCPFPCTYCGARMFNQLYQDQPGTYGRRRSQQNVIDEILTLRETGPVNWVNFIDDTFTIHRPWVREFCRMYKAQVGVGFSLLARVDTVDERLIADLAAAGCQQITYGVESGSYRVRRDIMRRPIRQKRFKDVFRWTREAGIRICANYMMGLPGERIEDLEQTYQLADELSEDAFDICYYVFYPYPGTALFHECQRRGILPDDYRERPANQRETILRLEHLTQDDLASYYERFTALRLRMCTRRQPQTAPEHQHELIEHVMDVARNG